MIVTLKDSKAPTGAWFDEGAVDSWQTFALGIFKLHEGSSAAKATGWQFTKQKDEKGDVRSTYMPGGPVGRAQDALSRKTQLAYEHIVALPQAQDPAQVWEVRSIRIHALYLHAMWLHSRSGAEDIVIPYLSYFPELREMQEYPLSVLLQVAKREAARLPLAPLV